MSKISIALGTRPEIIKLSPVIRECDRRGIDYDLIHTGQHYSDNLDQVFFDQLELPEPDFHLEVGSKSHGQQTAEMIAGIEEILLKTEPDILHVQGDTNSVLAGSIAASKLNVKLGHVEAGLRSFDRDMPEETNRVLTDHTADYLFAPTEQSASYLRQEGITSERITVTGNTVVDAVKEHRTLAERKSEVLTELDLKSVDYGLLTAHRAENVDTPRRFADILAGAQRVGQRFDLKIVYPIHPRARQQLSDSEIDVPERVRVIEPCDYLDFLRLEMGTDIILTDSGGVQEEACILGVPCVTLRDNTERPETVDVDANVVAGTDPEAIESAAETMLNHQRDWSNPFGDGTTSEQIIETVLTPETVEVIQ